MPKQEHCLPVNPAATGRTVKLASPTNRGSLGRNRWQLRCTGCLAENDAVTSHPLPSTETYDAWLKKVPPVWGDQKGTPLTAPSHERAPFGGKSAPCLSSQVLSFRGVQSCTVRLKIGHIAKTQSTKIPTKP